MKCRSMLMLILLIVAPLAHSATGWMGAKVTKTVVASGGTWGGCMALLNKNIAASTGLNCPDAWVTFSCSGTYAKKDIAYRMFDSAQMAWTLKQSVVLQIDDSKKHNGFCFAPVIFVEE